MSFDEQMSRTMTCSSVVQEGELGQIGLTMLGSVRVHLISDRWDGCVASQSSYLALIFKLVRGREVMDMTGSRRVVDDLAHMVDNDLERRPRSVV